MAEESDGTRRMPETPFGHAGLHRGDLGLVVAVLAAGVVRQRDAVGLGRGLGAFAHLDEERVRVGLGDEAGGDLLLREGRAGHGDESQRGAGEKLLHGVPPCVFGAGSPAPPIPAQAPGTR
jgi:hypothetical protein